MCLCMYGNCIHHAHTYVRLIIASIHERINEHNTQREYIAIRPSSAEETEGEGENGPINTEQNR